LVVFERIRKADGVATRALPKSVLSENVVDVIASELARGVERAVDCWMSQIEQALTDAHLTSLGRLNAVRDIMQSYKSLTGKMHLVGRKDSVGHEL
jgi:hypothetical protein